MPNFSYPEVVLVGIVNTVDPVVGRIVVVNQQSRQSQPGYQLRPRIARKVRIGLVQASPEAPRR